MKVYNTLTRKKEELVTLTPGVVKMYACGPTVYNYFHIGNARPFIVFDTLRRYLEYRGNKVIFAQNFTDIDDKMIKRANDEGISVKELGERFIAEYYKDADALGIERATFNPKATEHIEEIIALIEKLIQKGNAYVAENGDVYFAPRTFEGYGKLSGQPLEELEAGARIDCTELKRDPTDFALWKAQKPGEPAWDSPWGKGRPGWHVECSAMSMKYLGETFDIHCGGVDLIFPHHENEIAQSEAATGKPFANYWMHNGFININNQKMSKSLNNFFTVREIAEEFDLETVRLFMLSAQYRNPVNFSRDLIEQAKAGLDRLKNAAERISDAQEAATEGEAAFQEGDAAFLASLACSREAFNNAMDDDLNTADAIGVLFDLARTTNTQFSQPRPKAEAKAAAALFGDLTHVLGILQTRDEIPADILEKAQKRQEARKAKNWALSDVLRNEITALGYSIEDTANGPKVKKL